MAYNVSFANGIVYGVDDINAIIRSITGNGVLWEGGNLAVSVSGGVATIATGTAVFASGAFIKITSPETITLPAGSIHFIYVEHSILENHIKPMVSSTMPSGDVVLLAQIQGSTVTDLREFSRAKIRGMGASVPREVNVTLNKAYTEGTVVYQTDFDITKYKYVFATSQSNSSTRSMAIFDIENNANVASISTYRPSSDWHIQGPYFGGGFSCFLFAQLNAGGTGSGTGKCTIENANGAVRLVHSGAWPYTSAVTVYLTFI